VEVSSGGGTEASRSIVSLAGSIAHYGGVAGSILEPERLDAQPPPSLPQQRGSCWGKRRLDMAQLFVDVSAPGVAANGGGQQRGWQQVAEKEFLGDRRRIQEEEYFQRQEQQLIARLRQRSHEEDTRRRLAERTGIADQEIVRDLESVGHTPETVMLLHLVPLVQVAWAEGGVSDRERALIIEAARAHGVDEGSAADRQLATWLATRPSAEFFERTLRAIGAILQALPSEERETSQRDLVSYCTAIAVASGGMLGFGKVSAEEQQVLARINQEPSLSHERSAGRCTQKRAPPPG